MAQVIAFWILAVVTVCAALGVVVLKNVFRSAMLLVLSFLAIAGIFILLSADFLAAIQVIIYVGAIGILIILAIMLTKEVVKGSPSNKFSIPALCLTALFFAGVTWAILNTQWPVSNVTPESTTAATLADKFFGENGFILPLEIVPVMLLATVLSAIVLVKDRK